MFDNLTNKSFLNWYYISLIIILISGIGIRWYWATLKEGMHVDEVASFSLAESLDGSYNRSLYEEDAQSRQMTGRELKQFFFIHDNSIDGIVSDLRSMHHRMFVHDHTNFYYSILRVFFYNVDSLDTKVIIRHGIFLNLIFFILSFIVLWRILLLYFDSKIIVRCTLSCFSFMPGAISDALFIRPYELQMFTVLLLAWWLSKIYIAMENGEWIYNIKNFIITAFVLAIVLWTGYFMSILVFVFGVPLLREISRRDNKYVGFVFFTGTVLCSLLICFVLYKGYFVGYQGDSRISEKILSLGSVARLMGSIKSWWQLLMQYTLPLFIVILFSIMILLRSIRVSYMPVFLPYAFLFTLLVMLLAPYPRNRYIVAVSPLLLLVIPSVLNSLKKQRSKYLLSFIVVSIYFISSLQEKNIEHLYKSPELTVLKSDEIYKIHFVQNLEGQLFWLVPNVSDDVTYNISKKVNMQEYKDGDIIVYSSRFYDVPVTFPSNRFEEIGKSRDYFIYRVNERN